MNVGECVEALAGRFEAAGLHYGHGTDNAWDEAVYLVFTVSGIAFDSAEDVAGQSIHPLQQQRIEELAQRRITERIPMAYLLGEAWFAGVPFYVDERVLIPRSPIAELIAGCFEPLLPEPPRRVLDLCTGSGCIGIATALAFPGAEVVLSDICADALQLAQRNIRRHKLQDRVTTIESDLFAALHAGPYDLIVSNPPYVGAGEVAQLPEEYKHEPALGLLSDDDGLAIPLTILRQATTWMTERGVLVLELGYTWPLLAERYPYIPVTWLEFEQGGEGVLAISREALHRTIW